MVGFIRVGGFFTLREWTLGTRAEGTQWKLEGDREQRLDLNSPLMLIPLSLITLGFRG